MSDVSESPDVSDVSESPDMSDVTGGASGSNSRFYVAAVMVFLCEY